MKMTLERKHRQRFLLRLPLSVRQQAAELALADGISLNRFISQAVAERVIRVASTTDDSAPGVADALSSSTPSQRVAQPSRIGVRRLATIQTTSHSRQADRLT